MISEAQHLPRPPRSVYADGLVYANLALSGQHQFTDQTYRYLERTSQLNRTSIMPDVALVIFSSKIGNAINP